MIRPLKYNSRLSFEEAKERYIGIKDEFEKIKSNYSGLFRRFKINLYEEDNKKLSDCIGVLLPLADESSVRNEIKQTQNIEDTLHHQIGQLSYRIIDYLANFENTGIKRVQKRLCLLFD